LVFFLRPLLAVSDEELLDSLTVSDEELLDRCFIHGTKHAKRARKKTNKNLLHTIQFVFKYVLATCLGFSINT